MKYIKTFENSNNTWVLQDLAYFICNTIEDNTGLRISVKDISNYTREEVWYNENPFHRSLLFTLNRVNKNEFDFRLDRAFKSTYKDSLPENLFLIITDLEKIIADYTIKEIKFLEINLVNVSDIENIKEEFQTKIEARKYNL